MKKKKKKAGTAAGREIIAALTDIAETLEGGIALQEKYRTRRVTIAEPGAYGPREVKALRERLGLSQMLFAGLIGASTILVRKWESGDRRPDGMARRLMDDIGDDPERFLRGLLQRAGAA